MLKPFIFNPSQRLCVSVTIIVASQQLQISLLCNLNKIDNFHFLSCHIFVAKLGYMIHSIREAQSVLPSDQSPAMISGYEHG